MALGRHDPDRFGRAAFLAQSVVQLLIASAMFAGAFYLTTTGNETAWIGYGAGVAFLILARLSWLHSRDLQCTRRHR